MVAFLMAGFYGGAIEGRKHDLDDAIAAFLVLFAAACVGASTGLQQEQEPPRTIADALQRADGCDSLVHHVPSAEKHLEETKEYQAKLDKRMHELFNEPQA